MAVFRDKVDGNEQQLLFQVLLYVLCWVDGRYPVFLLTSGRSQKIALKSSSILPIHDSQEKNKISKYSKLKAKLPGFE